MPANLETMTTCGDRILVAKTCGKCGQLKLALHFHRRNVTAGRLSKAYESWCRTCVSRKAQDCNRKANDASLEKATHYREVWTKDDIDTLLRLVHLGLSSRAIAERLGRTVSGVSNRIVLLRREQESSHHGVRLFYYDSRLNCVKQVGAPFLMIRKGHEGRLNRAAQELSELHPQLIFFIQVDEGGEYMGIRGLDALKQGDDREPEDTSEDLEALTAGNNS